MAEAAPGTRSPAGDYAAHRRRQIAYGSWAPKHDAEPVRRHVAALRASGLTLADIAARARRTSGHRVALSTLRALVYGRGNDTPPSRWVHRRTAAALLSVRVGADPARVQRLRQIRLLGDCLSNVGRAASRPGGPSALAVGDQEQLDGEFVRLFSELLAADWTGRPSLDLRARRARSVVRALFRSPIDPATRRLVVRALGNEPVSLPVPSIAETLNVSTRTVQRDLSVS